MNQKFQKEIILSNVDAYINQFVVCENPKMVHLNYIIKSVNSVE